MPSKKEIVPIERIMNRIFYIRKKKVMFDRDLAELYEVETKALNQSVKRNRERFPEDFMFQLTKREFENWVSQIVTSNEDEKSLRSQFVTSKKGGRRYIPYVFTEQGVAMLSSVLKSQRAIQANIAIMRTFTKLREILLTNKELREKIEKMEKKYDEKFRTVFEVIKKLIKEEERPKTEIGFKIK
ncbi:MAG TPA: ORF6N domain-containing protein [Patescibacteria group bacterium]|nr:ORF6N domain-containing protein [Patescibacteria group bacterium]